MSITSRRKAQFCHALLRGVSSKIGFADIGSGGELKSPWNLLPVEKINKFDFDPEELDAQAGLPICISNREGQQIFYVARDPRASSLHKASLSFVERFNQHSILAKETIQVRCTTLDRYFAGRLDKVDLLDVNVEGHDYQVLQGATRLLTEGFVKCIKVEFELTEVWQEQGWFGDIDLLLRDHRYDLANIYIGFSRPANVRTIFHKGEPLWGKAIYVPSLVRWSHRQNLTKAVVYRDDVLKAVVFYTILDIPGRAVDLLNLTKGEVHFAPFSADEIASRIFAVFKYARIDARRLRLIGLLRRLLPT